MSGTMLFDRVERAGLDGDVVDRRRCLDLPGNHLGVGERQPVRGVLVGGKLHADDEVFPDGGADALDDLLQEPHPILERAAPLVVATIAYGERNCATR